jgi:cyclic pyranopterin phosphate synthase
MPVLLRVIAAWPEVLIPAPEENSGLKKRFYCKLYHAKIWRDMFACVGCGRCTKVCPVNLEMESLVVPMSLNHGNSKIDYLRISVTDRCNLRCLYCMPREGIASVPPGELLTFEEIIRLVKILVKLGIGRLRFTGGEPLVRKDLVNLITALAEIPGIRDLALTTNGILLADYAGVLRESGISRLNISLDTLKPDRFETLTGIDAFSRLLSGIERARSLDFSSLKLNTVVMCGINTDEIIDFVKFALAKELVLRFIEFMPITPLWKEEYFFPIEEVKAICRNKFNLEETDLNLGPGPAQYYRVGEKGILGFIKTEEENCCSCSRLRLTSTGEFKLCLYEQPGFSLRDLLRKGASDSEISGLLEAKLNLKKEVDYRFWEVPRFYMSNVGG